MLYIARSTALWHLLKPEIAPVQYKHITNLSLHGVQRYREVAAKLLGEVHRDTRMNTTLPVEQAALVIDRDDGAVPDARMNVEAIAAIATEGDELLRRHVVPWKGQRDHETLAMRRIEQLAAIRMIVGAPD